MKKRSKVLENIKGSQTEVPQGGNRENSRKVIFEEIMALEWFLDHIP